MSIIFIRTLIIFVSLVILMRLLGKRQLRELELSELVVSVLLADMAATPLQDTSIPLVNGLIPIFTLFACELAISGGILSSVKFRELMCGKPSFLIINGEIQEKEMRKASLSANELFEELRSKEILDISTVQYAVLENDGTLSTVLVPSQRPVTAGQMGLTEADTGYPIIVIEDGSVMSDNLRYLGKSKQWLSQEIKKNNCKSPDDIFLMVCYENGTNYCIPKEKNNA